MLPASLGTLTAAVQPGLFTDGVTDDSTTFTSATADFTEGDLYSYVWFPDGAFDVGVQIQEIIDSSHAQLTQGSSITTTGVTFMVGAQVPLASLRPV